MFYFNECLPASVSEAEFILKFSNTLYEFNKLYKKDIGVEPHIVTHDLPSLSKYGNNFNLHSIIEKLPNDDLRKVAFGFFYKSPISEYFSDRHPELVTDEYSILMDGEKFEAINLAIVKLNNGFLFTLGLNTFLETHPLSISTRADSETDFDVDNLFGDKDNTQEIEKIIIDKNNSTLDQFEKLKLTVGDCAISKNFEKSFNNLTEAQKNAIIERFSRARERSGLSPFFVDNDLIKEAKGNEKKCKIYELRVFSVFDMRVYFHEGSKMYLGDIGFKSHGNQDNDIKAAQNLLHKMQLVK